MQNRRETLKHSALVAGLLAGTGLFPPYALPFNAPAFEAKTLGDAFKRLGLATPQASKDVTITAPDIAENGAVVPFSAATTLAGVSQNLFLVEKNPTVLIAAFKLTDNGEANVSTRAKMAQTSDVYAVAVLNKEQRQN